MFVVLKTETTGILTRSIVEREKGWDISVKAEQVVTLFSQNFFKASAFQVIGFWVSSKWV